VLGILGVHDEQRTGRGVIVNGAGREDLACSETFAEEVAIRGTHHAPELGPVVVHRCDGEDPDGAVVPVLGRRVMTQTRGRGVPPHCGSGGSNRCANVPDAA
jgi:hypothetical protein